MSSASTWGDGLLKQLLTEGEVDAAILNQEVATTATMRPLIPDAEEAAARWFAETSAVQVNHLAVVDADLSRERPDVVREIYRLLVAARRAMPAQPGRDTLPYGLEANRRNSEVAIGVAHEHGLIPDPVDVDDLFDDVTRNLDD